MMKTSIKTAALPSGDHVDRAQGGHGLAGKVDCDGRFGHCNRSTEIFVTAGALLAGYQILAGRDEARCGALFEESKSLCRFVLFVRE